VPQLKPHIPHTLPRVKGAGVQLQSAVVWRKNLAFGQRQLPTQIRRTVRKRTPRFGPQSTARQFQTAPVQPLQELADGPKSVSSRDTPFSSVGDSFSAIQRDGGRCDVAVLLLSWGNSRLAAAVWRRQ